MIRFECPFCSELYELDDDAAGLPCECFACSKKFAVPSADGSINEVIDSDDGSTVLPFGIIKGAHDASKEQEPSSVPEGDAAPDQSVKKAEADQLQPENSPSEKKAEDPKDGAALTETGESPEKQPSESGEMSPDAKPPADQDLPHNDEQQKDMPEPDSSLSEENSGAKPEELSTETPEDLSSVKSDNLNSSQKTEKEQNESPESKEESGELHEKETNGKEKESTPDEPADSKKDEAEIEKKELSESDNTKDTSESEEENDNDDIVIALRPPAESKQLPKKGDDAADDDEDDDIVIALRPPSERKQPPKKSDNDDDAIRIKGPASARKPDQPSTKKKKERGKPASDRSVSRPSKSAKPQKKKPAVSAKVPANKVSPKSPARKVSRPPRNYPAQKRGGGIVSLLIILIVFSGLGYGGYYVFNNMIQNRPAKHKRERIDLNTEVKTVSKLPVSTGLPTHKSSRLTECFPMVKQDIPVKQNIRERLLNNLEKLDIPLAGQNALVLVTPYTFPLLISADKLNINNISAFYANNESSAVIFAGKSAMEKVLSADSEQAGIFLDNILGWFTEMKDGDSTIVVRQNTPSAELLKRTKISGTKTRETSAVNTAALADADILMAEALKSEPECRAALEFFKKGGALFISTENLSNYSSGKELLKYLGIRVLKTQTVNITAGPKKLPVEYLNACCALNAAVNYEIKRSASLGDSSGLISKTLLEAQNCGLPKSSEYVRNVDKSCSALATRTEGRYDKIMRPLSPLFKLLFFRNMQERIISGNTSKAPESELYPGKVAESAVRTTVTVTLNTAVPFWHTTGLYAAPGEKITIKVPSSVIGKGYKLIIGGDTYIPSPQDDWYRPPSVSVSKEITSPTTEFTSPYGGLIYIVIPYNQNGVNLYTPPPAAYHTVPLFTPKKDKFTFEGVIRIGVYANFGSKEGNSNPQDFLDKVKEIGVPFYEIKSSRIILELPSKDIADNQSPDAILMFWEQFLDTCNMAVGLGRDFIAPFPLLIISDSLATFLPPKKVYPLFWPDRVADLLYTTYVAEKSIPFMANHISRIYTGKFSKIIDDTKVANLLFLMYVSKIASNRDRFSLHKNLTRKMGEKYTRQILASKDRIRSSVTFGRVIPYTMLVDEFGWDPLISLIDYFNKLPDKKWPKTREEINFEMVRFLSERTNKNLFPFFQIWGVKMKGRSSREIWKKTAWLPDGFPEKYITIE